MDVGFLIGRSWRNVRHAGLRRHALQLLWFLVLGVLIGIGQGLFELYVPGQGIWKAIQSTNGTWWLAVGATCAGVLLTSEALWRLVARPRAGRAALDAALKMTVRSFGLGEDANARVAVYIAEPSTKSPRRLFHESPYVYAHAHGKDYGLGIEGIHESIGIVGRVFRGSDEFQHEGLSVRVSSASKTEFVKKLVEDWSFPFGMAEKIDPSRPNYMVLRFRSSAEHGRSPIEGVLYFDARGDTTVFNKATILRVAKEQRDVIVQYVEQCYGRSGKR